MNAISSRETSDRYEELNTCRELNSCRETPVVCQHPAKGRLCAGPARSWVAELMLFRG
jgi:hypothetical protein